MDNSKETINDLIAAPEYQDEANNQLLRNQVEIYPYCQSLRLAVARHARVYNLEDAESLVALAAIYAPDRIVLFNLMGLNGKNRPVTNGQVVPVETRDNASQVAPVETKASTSQVAPVEAKASTSQVAPVEAKASTSQVAPVETRETASQVEPFEPAETFVEPAAKSVGLSATPVEQTAKSVGLSATPVEQTASPVEQTASPVEQTATSVEAEADYNQPTAIPLQLNASSVEAESTAGTDAFSDLNTGFSKPSGLKDEIDLKTESSHLAAKKALLERNAADQIPVRKTFLYWLKKTQRGYFLNSANLGNSTEELIETDTPEKAATDPLAQNYMAGAFVLTDSEAGKQGAQVEFDSNKKEDQLIRQFLNEDPQHIKPNHPAVDQQNVNNLVERASKDAGIVTETLAAIYYQQKQYEKALKAYDDLRLKFPNKSAYFADLHEKIRNEVAENK